MLAECYYYKKLNNKKIIKQYRTAIEKYKSTTKSDTYIARSYYRIGNCYGKKKLFNKAIKYLKLAVKYKLDFERAYFSLCFYYMRKGLSKNAMEGNQIQLGQKEHPIDIKNYNVFHNQTQI